MIDTKEIWIKTGYEFFALDGPNGLKIEPLAKRVGISKSSFYHHFADLELFTDQLLQYHIQQSYSIAEKEQKALTIDPDLITIILEHKIDILFSRQLRIHRNQKVFAETLLKSNEIVGNAFVLPWVRELNLKLSLNQLQSIFELALENFFLQVSQENLTQSWLSAYFSNLKKLISNFVND